MPATCKTILPGVADWAFFFLQSMSEPFPWSILMY
jgi:hypothetical protein